MRHLAVSELEEALTLRRLGISAEIMLLSPLCDGGELEEAPPGWGDSVRRLPGGGRGGGADGPTPGLHWKGAAVCGYRLRPLRLSWQQPQQIWEAARTLERLRVVGTYSHLRRGADPEGGETRRQEQRLTQVCDALAASGVEPGVRHLVESYGLLCCPESRLDGVRIGSAFLGRLPFRDLWGFESIGALCARVREVRTLEARSTVGYGSGFVTRRPTRIAVVGAGYAHGFGLERSAAPGGRGRGGGLCPAAAGGAQGTAVRPGGPEKTAGAGPGGHVRHGAGCHRHPGAARGGGGAACQPHLCQCQRTPGLSVNMGKGGGRAAVSAARPPLVCCVWFSAQR